MNMLRRQTSNDSDNSSDLSLEDDREREITRQDLEERARQQLERAKKKELTFLVELFFKNYFSKAFAQNLPLVKLGTKNSSREQAKEQD
ncbi:hypothetical protein T4D_5316 [Trichinella pseudospiralis]|uniref:Voltage-dependent L-type calcium channel subunit beta-1-4 N-terminal A domain-containing protein n=1 Tax=Trichinella pseudospiralis TaxID=6337 RepID=A0A0V1FWS5_TRIPS|nr:hypothetical protein T4D_5316 [Trichinella pseudospiralis]